MQSHHAIVLRNRVTKSRDAVSWGFMISCAYDCTKSEHKEIQDALKEAQEMCIAPAYGTQSFGETCMSGGASADIDPRVRTQAGKDAEEKPRSITVTLAKEYRHHGYRRSHLCSDEPVGGQS